MSRTLASRSGGGSSSSRQCPATVLQLADLGPHWQAAMRANGRLKRNGFTPNRLKPLQQLAVLEHQRSVLARQGPDTLPFGHEIRGERSQSRDYLPNVSHVEARVAPVQCAANKVRIPIVGVCPRPP